VSQKLVHKSVEPCSGLHLPLPSKRRVWGHGCGGLNIREWPAPTRARGEGTAPNAPLRDLGKETLHLNELTGTGGGKVQWEEMKDTSNFAEEPQSSWLASPDFC
jgi:hypothetical protein